MGAVRKVLGQANPAAATDGVLLTVPASTDEVISTIAIAETNGAAAVFRVCVRAAGGTTTTVATAIAWNAPLTANQFATLTIGATLEAGGTIVVRSDTGNVTFTAFGQQNT